MLEAALRFLQSFITINQGRSKLLGLRPHAKGSTFKRTRSNGSKLNGNSLWTYFNINSRANYSQTGSRSGCVLSLRIRQPSCIPSRLSHSIRPLSTSLATSFATFSNVRKPIFRTLILAVRHYGKALGMKSILF